VSFTRSEALIKVSQSAISGEAILNILYLLQLSARQKSILRQLKLKIERFSQKFVVLSSQSIICIRVVIVLLFKVEHTRLYSLACFILLLELLLDLVLLASKVI